MNRFSCDDFTCDAECVDGGSAVLAIRGEFDMHNADEVNHVLDRVRRNGSCDHLVFDLTECTFIDSIGLSVLIAAQHKAKSPLDVVATSQALRRVLSVTGLDSIFTLHETLGEAMDGLHRRIESQGPDRGPSR
jgi:anti-sigma B factor antagonist